MHACRCLRMPSPANLMHDGRRRRLVRFACAPLTPHSAHPDPRTPNNSTHSSHASKGAHDTSMPSLNNVFRVLTQVSTRCLHTCEGEHHTSSHGPRDPIFPHTHTQGALALMPSASPATVASAQQYLRGQLQQSEQPPLSIDTHAHYHRQEEAAGALRDGGAINLGSTDLVWTGDRQKIRVNGQPFHLKGISWFGFELQQGVLLGLEQRNMSTPIPNQAHGPNVPLSPGDPAPQVDLVQLRADRGAASHAGAERPAPRPALHGSLGDCDPGELPH